MKGIRTHAQWGMSLIEVMVALLVLGIGVMGYAALQLRSVKMSEDTYARSQAMAIGQDAIERIRANFNGLASYTTANWRDAPAANAPSPACNFTGAAPAACTAEQIAAVDIHQLKTIARTMLPSGSIAVTSCQRLTCVIVAWNDTIAATSTDANTTECKQNDIGNDDRGDAAHCVVIDFI